MHVQHFFDERTCTLSTVAHDGEKLQIPYAIDTHEHADHMTGLPFFKERYGARTVTGARVGEVQRVFRDIYNLGSDFPVDGRQFDVLLDDGRRLGFGTLELEALHTPGHTPAHMSWKIGDAVFVGDTLFMGHDYLPKGRPLAVQTTVAEQRLGNIQINGRTSD